MKSGLPFSSQDFYLRHEWKIRSFYYLISIVSKSCIAMEKNFNLELFFLQRNPENKFVKILWINNIRISNNSVRFIELFPNRLIKNLTLIRFKKISRPRENLHVRYSWIKYIGERTTYNINGNLLHQKLQ